MDSRIVTIKEVCSELFVSNVGTKMVGLFIGGVLPLLLDRQLNELYFAAGVLVLMDFLSGYAVVLTVPGARIESRKVIKSFSKALIYTIGFVSARQAEILTFNVVPFIDEAILGYIGIHELISVLENFERMGLRWAHRIINVLSNYKGMEKNWDKEHPILSKRK